MALRTIVLEGDDILNKKCRPVEKFDGRLEQMMDDLVETLAATENGVGLAAPQVGILRRFVVINVGEGPIELVNPTIIAQEGEQEAVEGCLSCPGEYGVTKRPMSVTVQAQDRKGNTFTVSGEGLLARALCHELDHLDGILFKAKASRMVDPSELEEEDENQ